jgi:hypothetical protein
LLAGTAEVLKCGVGFDAVDQLHDIVCLDHRVGREEGRTQRPEMSVGVTQYGRPLPGTTVRSERTFQEHVPIPSRTFELGRIAPSSNRLILLKTQTEY